VIFHSQIPIVGGKRVHFSARKDRLEGASRGRAMYAVHKIGAESVLSRIDPFCISFGGS
jgi:hypothetical protein